MPVHYAASKHRYLSFDWDLVSFYFGCCIWLARELSVPIFQGRSTWGTKPLPCSISRHLVFLQSYQSNWLLQKDLTFMRSLFFELSLTTYVGGVLECFDVSACQESLIQIYQLHLPHHFRLQSEYTQTFPGFLDWNWPSKRSNYLAQFDYCHSLELPLIDLLRRLLPLDLYFHFCRWVIVVLLKFGKVSRRSLLHHRYHIKQSN